MGISSCRFDPILQEVMWKRSIDDRLCDFQTIISAEKSL